MKKIKLIKKKTREVQQLMGARQQEHIETKYQLAEDAIEERRKQLNTQTQF